MFGLLNTPFKRAAALPIALVIGVIVFVAFHASAATATPASPPVLIDLSSTINGTLLPFITSIAIALVGWAATKIGAYFHIQVSAANRTLLDTAITNAISFAQSKAGPGEVLSVPTQAALAVQYLLPKIPGALAWLKITPSALAELITARL